LRKRQRNQSKNAKQCYVESSYRGLEPLESRRMFATWTGAVSTLFNVAGNWDTVAVPESSQDAVFSKNGSSVKIDAPSAVGSLQVIGTVRAGVQGTASVDVDLLHTSLNTKDFIDSGTALFSSTAGAGLLTTADVLVGNSNATVAGDAVLSLSQNATAVSGDTLIGNKKQGGVLNVNGTGALITNNLVVSARADGAVNVTDGGTLVAYGNVNVGASPNAAGDSNQGVITVDGTGSQLNAGSLSIASNAGVGRVYVQAGASLITGPLTVENGSTGHTLGSEPAILRATGKGSTLTVNGPTLIGLQPPGTVQATDGSLEIVASATATVGDIAMQGANSALLVSDEGSLTAGKLQVYSGTVEVNDARLVTGSAFLMGVSPSSPLN
jgi:hypothetical protein